MEEVWEDMNLSSLQENPGSSITSNTNHSTFPSMILQDFLSKPFSKDQTRRNASLESSFLEGTTPLASIELPPTTALSLELVSNPISQSHASGFSSSSGSSMMPKLTTLASSPSSSVSSCMLKKWFGRNHDNSGDRTHKRMIKNRESAARSRARKQIYTNQLELQVAQLKEENAILIEQHQKLLAAAKQLPERKLERCTTAPF